MENIRCKSSRREFLKAGATAMGAIALESASPQSVAGAAPQPPRPNFIFVTTDGHRPEALSLNGNSILRTPNIDRIGREGIQLQNSFVVNALCLPSRATALTGLYSHNTGCVDNKNSRVVPAEVPLFTDHLREAGYEVALFGKAHIGRLGSGSGTSISVFPEQRRTTFGLGFKPDRTVGSTRTRFTKDMLTTSLRKGRFDGSSGNVKSPSA